MSEPRVRCLISFDYEVFHGRNFGAFEEVLFRPTEALLDLCDELGVPTTWFPDVCSDWWHRERGEHAFADRFEGQMRDAVRRGHDVQLHVHPHWLYTTGRDGVWQPNAERIYLHEIGFDDPETGATALLRRGAAWLEALLRPVDPGYGCVAYRAAALALQPEEGRHLQALIDAGIAIDSSVMKGVHTGTDTYVVDYRDVPEPPNWFMSPATGVATAASAGVFEVPVGTFRIGPAARVAFLLRRLLAARQRRGTGMSRHEHQRRLGNLWHLALQNVRYLVDPWLTLSCDTKGFDARMVVEGLGDHVRRHERFGDVAVSVINHPKLMFEPQRALLRRLVEEARRAFGPRLEFTTFRALAGELPGRGNSCRKPASGERSPVCGGSEPAWESPSAPVSSDARRYARRVAARDTTRRGSRDGIGRGDR